MKNKLIRYYALIVVFLVVPLIFYTESQVSLSEFLIFLFSGILIGINICKIKNAKKDDK